MNCKKFFWVGIIALGSMMANVGKAEAVIYAFEDAVPNPSDPLSLSGFFDIDDSLGTTPGEVEFGTELTDYSFEISSSTPGVNSVTLVPSNSALDISDLSGVSVSDSQLDFSTANSGSSLLCVSNNGCIVSTTDGEAAFPLGNGIFNLELGGEPDSNFENNEFALGSFADFPQQIDAANSAAVPFEFSPSLGLILIGGVWGVSRYKKSRKAKNIMENN